MEEEKKKGKRKGGGVSLIFRQLLTICTPANGGKRPGRKEKKKGKKKQCPKAHPSSHDPLSRRRREGKRERGEKGGM